MPIDRFLSHLYVSKPSDFILSETRLTWELSMACKVIPVLEQSKIASVRRSLIDSRTFFHIEPWTRRASNILTFYVFFSLKKLFVNGVRWQLSPVQVRTSGMKLRHLSVFLRWQQENCGNCEYGFRWLAVKPEDTNSALLFRSLFIFHLPVKSFLNNDLKNNFITTYQCLQFDKYDQTLFRGRYIDLYFI